MRTPAPLSRAGRAGLDPASERAFRHLQRAILSGEIVGGTRLIEGQLAEQLGISRTPIREALRRLAQDGFIEFVPRGGAVVRLITPEDVGRAYACRAVLEGLAARIASTRRTERDLFEMREVQRQARAALSERPIEDVLALNGRFHHALITGVGDPVILELVDHLALYTARYRQTVLDVSRASAEARHRYMRHMAHLIAEHDRLIELIASGEADQAEQFIRRHLDATAAEMADILRTFGDRGAVPGA